MNPGLKTEKDYQEFAKIGKRLGIPVFEAFLTLEVFDKGGKLIEKRKQRSHSWTRNPYNILFSQLGGVDCPDSTFAAGKMSGKNTSGTVLYAATGKGFGWNHDSNLNTTGLVGSAGSNSIGIQVGTGTDAESFEDYVLQTIVVDGNGAGELAYSAGDTPTVAYVAGTKTFTVTHIRYMNNNSGGSITVNEVGLVGNYQCAGSGATSLVSRDKLGTGVAVADTAQLKVTYTISLVYAS